MISAVIVAAGKGTRMGPDVDKLFLEVAGRPLLVHAWQRLETVEAISEIILVVRDGMQPEFMELSRQYGLRKRFRLALGGQERQDSVWNGLQAVDSRTEMVVVQDAARPCTTPALILATIEAARQVGAAVAAQRITDTIKESDGGTRIVRTLNRERLWAVQTPQTFRAEVLRRALAEVRRQQLSVTDDTAACELIGQPVKLVESVQPNPKVTVPGDLPYVAWLLRGA